MAQAVVYKRSEPELVHVTARALTGVYWEAAGAGACCGGWKTHEAWLIWPGGAVDFQSMIKGAVCSPSRTLLPQWLEAALA